MEPRRSSLFPYPQFPLLSPWSPPSPNLPFLSFPSFSHLSPLEPSNSKWLKDECERLDIQNMALSRTMASLKDECESLKEQLEELENPEVKLLKKKLKKRKRRIAAEIPRHFTCWVCDKSYGSEGSLNQHVKLKHEGEEMP